MSERSSPPAWRILRKVAPVGLLLVFASCAYQPLVPYSRDLEPLDLSPGSPGGLADGRGRFREIFCAIMERHGRDLPDSMPCYEALVRVGHEPPPTRRPVRFGPTGRHDLVYLVPGLGYQCIKEWLMHDYGAPGHVQQFGYEAYLLEVNGLSSSSNNAREIRDFVAALPSAQAARPLILIGYSKGANDILEAVVNYPELASRVVAVVSFAGAIGGSLLADDATQSQLNLLTRVPRSQCDEGDGGALESLRPEVRKRWLAEHELPGHIRYYSVVSFPEPGRISAGLKPGYRKIGELADARNDSQLVFYDQVIPGSTLLAFANADHWAMAVPVARQHPFAAQTFATENGYPREVMFETLLRFLEEDLAE